ncbi:MAG: hypothetical protein NTZ79_17420 [Proteobacteria bacterium]|nr:hypothetical protein [Pseudomonadota bacterium]
MLKSTGTVSDFDSAGGFGVIEADDGTLLLFSVPMPPSSRAELLRVGTRVMFEVDRCGTGRAIAPQPIIPSRARSDSVAGTQQGIEFP